MEVLLVLIPVSIVLAAASVVACLAAIRAGQYDDLESPRWRILFDGRRDDGAAGGKKDDGGTMTTKRESEHTGATGPHTRRSNPL